jgi:hypothetical protein
MLYSPQFAKSLVVWTTWLCVEEWGRLGSSNHPLPLDSPTRLRYSATQSNHGQLFDSRFLTSYLLLCSQQVTLCYCVVPPERSFLAYAFPLLDMCSLCLSYLYLSSFPISPCAVIPFAYDHHHHHHNLLFVFIYLKEKKKQSVPTYFRSVLSVPCLL